MPTKRPLKKTVPPVSAKKRPEGHFSVKKAKKQAKSATGPVKRTPIMTPMANSFRHIKPSWRDYTQYVELAASEGNKDAAKFVETFSALSKSDRQTLMPEAVCKLAEIRPSALYGAVCGQVYEYQQGESTMLAALNHPKVLGNIVKHAAKTDNYKDRELFMRTTGSLPDKGGASVHIHNNPQAIAAAGAKALSDPAEGAIPAFRNMRTAVAALDKILPPVDKSRVIDLRPAKGESETEIGPIPIPVEACP